MQQLWLNALGRPLHRCNRTSNSLMHLSVCCLTPWCTEASVVWSSGALEHLFSDSFMQWSICYMILWCTGASVVWSSDALQRLSVIWSSYVLERLLYDSVMQWSVWILLGSLILEWILESSSYTVHTCTMHTFKHAWNRLLLECMRMHFCSCALEFTGSCAVFTGCI